jgi:MoaA/NifB/PqqE/SkfB family radical SAM enzyme
VTATCNYKCSYCCVSAENHGFEGKRLSIDEMLDIGSLMYERGVRVFRITGGEPTTWPGLGPLIKGIHRYGDDTWVNLNSNGSLPRVLLPLLADNRERFTLRVSVDRVTPAPETPKYLSDELVATLQDARGYVPVRLNMVVMRTNLHELPELLRRCDELGFDLKLLDLYYNREFFGVVGQAHDDNRYWWKNFVPILDSAGGSLEAAGFRFVEQYDDGGYGIPLPVYTNGNIYVSIKDSTRGTHYNSSCSSCSEFRCQEGFYSPMLSYNGTLHISECRFQPFMFELAGRSREAKEDAVERMLALFADRTFSGELSTLLQDYQRESGRAGGGVPEGDAPPTRAYTYRAKHGPRSLPILQVSSGER